MTFAEKLTHVAKDDPKFARSVKRMRVAQWVFGVGVFLAIAAGIWAVAVNYQQGAQITRIESPCVRYGSQSKQCEEAFSAAVATITHPQACAIERKAGTLRAIRELADGLGVDFNEPCAGARIAQERERGNERAASARARDSRPSSPNSNSVISPGPGSSGGPPAVEPPRRAGEIDRPTDRPSRPNAPSVPDQPPPRAQPSPAPFQPGSSPSQASPPFSPPKVIPELPPPAKGPVGDTVEAVTGLGCSVTNPLTGICLR